MKKSLTSLVLFLSFSSDANALIVDTKMNYMSAHGTCEYQGYKIEVICNGTPTKNICKTY